MEKYILVSTFAFIAIIWGCVLYDSAPQTKTETPSVATKTETPTGAIYGRVGISVKPSQEEKRVPGTDLFEVGHVPIKPSKAMFIPDSNAARLLKKVKMTIKETGFSIGVDSLGFFYIPDLPLGEYSLMGQGPELHKHLMEKVEVIADSISLVNYGLFYFASHFPEWLIFPWEGIHVKKVDLNTRGDIAGYVKRDPSKGFAKIVVGGTFWYTYPDAKGNYYLSGILPGIYKVSCSAPPPSLISGNPPGTYSTVFLNVEVVPDSLAVVNFFLSSKRIPNAPRPGPWKRNIQKRQRPE